MLKCQKSIHHMFVIIAFKMMKMPQKVLHPFIAIVIVASKITIASE